MLYLGRPLTPPTPVIKGQGRKSSTGGDHGWSGGNGDFLSPLLYSTFSVCLALPTLHLIHVQEVNVLLETLEANRIFPQSDPLSDL